MRDTPEFYERLDPGIREIVRSLRANGFQTTDSGDGTSKAGGEMDFIPCPHVYAHCDPSKLCEEADRLLQWMDETCLIEGKDRWMIEGIYFPAARVGLLGLTGPEVE